MKGANTVCMHVPYRHSLECICYVGEGLVYVKKLDRVGSQETNYCVTHLCHLPNPHGLTDVCSFNSNVKIDRLHFQGRHSTSGSGNNVMFKCSALFI